MDDENTKKRTDFIYGISITLGTIVIGLISYILYSENISKFKEPPRCEYNGWAYADKESFDSEDGCNVCFCHTGEVICTQKECSPSNNLDSPTP